MRNEDYMRNFVYIGDKEAPTLIAALKARNTYLQGLIQRQLNYPPTSTRNRKLEALETEQMIVEKLYFRILGEFESISQPPTAPKSTKSDYFKILQQ